MTARTICARRGPESTQFRKFLVCGRSRVPVHADDHVDAADGGAGGRLRQAGDGDMLARNVEQLAGILEKEVMMVTDIGAEIGAAEIHITSCSSPASMNWRSVL